MQRRFYSTTALQAADVLTTAWFEVQGSADYPYVWIDVSADQDGDLVVYEDSRASAVLKANVRANRPSLFQVQLSGQRFQVEYTNGDVAQGDFSFSVRTSSRIALEASRYLELILRELRVTNLLLQQLREPYQSSVSVPIGPDQATN